MTVKQMIDALMDCRSDAEVVRAVFDNSSDFSKIKGVSNQGNFVVLYELISWDSHLKKATEHEA